MAGIATAAIMALAFTKGRFGASLTTEADAIVGPIRPKTMPVILTTPAEIDEWLSADIGDTLAFQRLLA